MSGPPTLFSKARTVLRVFFPLLFAFLLFGTDVGQWLRIPPDALAWIYFGGIVLFYATPGMVEYPVTTFGKARRVDADPIDASENRRCTVCGSQIEAGEHREYAEQWVAFGVPITNVDWGENDYCAACADPDRAEGQTRVYGDADVLGRTDESADRGGESEIRREPETETE